MSPETSFGLTGRQAAGAAFGATAHTATPASARVTGSATISAAALATISQAEAKAWAGFFTLAAHNPAFADEVTRLFDADPPLKRHHLTLYLHGRACLCQHQARQQRRQRRSAWLQAARGFMVEHLFAGPWATLKGLAADGTDQQPLLLPAIVWNDRDAVDPIVQPIDSNHPAALKTPSATLVH